MNVYPRQQQRGSFCDSKSCRLAWPSLLSNNRSFHSFPPFSSPAVRFNFARTSRCSFFPFLTTRRYSLGNFSVFTSASTTTSPALPLLILVSLFSFFFALFLYSSFFFEISRKKRASLTVLERNTTEYETSKMSRGRKEHDKTTNGFQVVTKRGNKLEITTWTSKKRDKNLYGSFNVSSCDILFMAKCARATVFSALSFFNSILPPFHSFHFLQPLAAFVSSVNFALRSVFCFSSTVYFYLSPFELSTVPISHYWQRKGISIFVKDYWPNKLALIYINEDTKIIYVYNI